MGQLYDNGNSISFMKDIWKVFKGAMVLAQGKKTSTLYMISLLLLKLKIKQNYYTTYFSIWLKRGWNYFYQKRKLVEIKLVDLDMCESYIIGKQKKLNFVKGSKAFISRKIKLEHLDLYGFCLVASLGCSWYYATLIGDFNKKVWVYLLENKLHVFQIFKKWKVIVKNESNLKKNNCWDLIMEENISINVVKNNVELIVLGWKNIIGTL